MSAKHTPGPWRMATTWGQQGLIGPVDGFPVASVTGYYGSNGESEANARLIAAAPILLQELRGANTQMEMAAECIEAGRYDEALLHVRSMSRPRRAAIAAATGETP